MTGRILSRFIMLPPLADVIHRARTIAINHQEHMVPGFCLLPSIHLYIKHLRDLHACHCIRHEEHGIIGPKPMVPSGYK